MAGLPGQNAYIAWVYSGGTVVLSTDFRTASYTPSGDMFDQTAGADTDKTYITGVKDGQFSFGGIYQSGGSVIYTALAWGTSGTVIYGREGTAVGSPKETIPAISQGAVVNTPYNNLMEISCTFQKNGAKVDATF